MNKNRFREIKTEKWRNQIVRRNMNRKEIEKIRRKEIESMIRIIILKKINLNSVRTLSHLLLKKSNQLRKGSCKIMCLILLCNKNSLRYIKVFYLYNQSIINPIAILKTSRFLIPDQIQIWLGLNNNSNSIISHKQNSCFNL